MESLCFFLAIASFYLLKYMLKFMSLGRAQLPLPPGTMGWPYIGETFQLYSQNPNTFFASEVSRYGSIFKTHILGCPCVMISSPEAARSVLVSNAHLLKPTFPASKERILGKQAIFFHQGPYHAKLRHLVLGAFMPESIKNIVPRIESLALTSLQSWEGRLITTFQEMKTYSFNVALLSIFGRDEAVYREELKRCYYVLEQGYNSLPLNLPGTLYNRAMKARKELAHILFKILWLRRQMKLHTHRDLLGSFMGDSEGLTDDQIADNIICGARHHCHCPNMDSQEEQEGIMKAKEDGGLTPRGCPLPQGFFKKLSGLHPSYLLPSGKLFRMLNFKVAPKPNTFLPFGNGSHACPGNELAKLEILILVHHLTTKYRFCVMGPQNGLPINVSLKT